MIYQLFINKFTFIKIGDIMRSITFARTPILPFLIGIPISFSTSAGVQGDFKSGGSGGGAMDIEYVNNYPYSRCSQENIPSEDCKEFGYVFWRRTHHVQAVYRLSDEHQCGSNTAQIWFRITTTYRITSTGYCRQKKNLRYAKITRDTARR